MRFCQNHKIVHGVLPVAEFYEVSTNTNFTVPISMANFGHATFILYEGVGTTGTATLTMQSCDNTTPDTQTAIAFDYAVMAPTAAVLAAGTANDTYTNMGTATTAGFATTAGSGHIYICEVDATGLYSTDQYVRLLATELVDAAVLAGVLVILSEPRMSGDCANWPAVLV